MPQLIRREATAPQLPLDLHPLLQRIYRQRGVSHPDDLKLELSGLEPPDSLKGIAKAVDLLHEALRQNWKILIVADFDADGATGCALAIETLFAFGYGQLDFIVPDRALYGYGLTPEIVELAACRNPDLLITVDNGISSVDGVAAARAAGMKVLITDHHLPGDRLPEAEAIINPNQPGCGFPAKNTAGVGVIFYLLAALRNRLRQSGWFGGGGPPEPDLRECLDLVALGTVADVVPFDRNNRILVNAGLRRIRAGKARPGVRALFATADTWLNPRPPTPADGNGDQPADTFQEGPQRQMALKNKLRDTEGEPLAALLAKMGRGATAADLAFRIAPRLNAAGRLEDMSTGIECLLSETPESARDLALTLDAINTKRKEIQAEMDQQATVLLQQFEAEFQIEEAPGGVARETRCDGAAGDARLRSGRKMPMGLCLFDPSWHPGVVGILASKIKDRLHRPIVVFAADAANPAAELKGSARSIPGFHIRDAFDTIASRESGLVSRFGGHAMAAGLSLAPENLDRFRTAFEREAARQLRPEQLQAALLSDGSLAPDWFTLEVAQMLHNAGPWGKDFPEPVFDGRFALRGQQILKEKHLRMDLSPLDAPDTVVGAIAFNVQQWPAPEAEEISLAYRLEINEFRGHRRLQLVVEQILTEPEPDAEINSS